MTAFVLGVLVSIVTGALVNEFCDVAPWLAGKVARRAAKMWALGDADIAREYAEEWSAVVDDCPGKLTKLGRALQFAFGAAGRLSAHRWQRFLVAVLRSHTIESLVSRYVAKNAAKTIERTLSPPPLAPPEPVTVHGDIKLGNIVGGDGVKGRGFMIIDNVVTRDEMSAYVRERTVADIDRAEDD